MVEIIIVSIAFLIAGIAFSISLMTAPLIALGGYLNRENRPKGRKNHE